MSEQFTFNPPTADEALTTETIYEPAIIEWLIAGLQDQGKSEIAAQIIKRQIELSHEKIKRFHHVRQSITLGQRKLIEAKNALTNLQLQQTRLQEEYDDYCNGHTALTESKRQSYLQAQLSKLGIKQTN